MQPIEPRSVRSATVDAYNFSLYGVVANAQVEINFILLYRHTAKRMFWFLLFDSI
jgi:hypothetical protein